MDQDRRALAQHLFAEITIVLEAAHSLAADGQDANLGARRGRDITSRLQAALDDVTCLAAAVRVVVGPSEPPRPGRRTREV